MMSFNNNNVTRQSLDYNDVNFYNILFTFKICKTGNLAEIVKQTFETMPISSFCQLKLE